MGVEKGSKAVVQRNYAFLVSEAFDGLIFQEGAGKVLPADCGCCSTHKNLLDQKIMECRGWQTLLL